MRLDIGIVLLSIQSPQDGGDVPSQVPEVPSRAHPVNTEPQNSQAKWQRDQEDSLLSLDGIIFIYLIVEGCWSCQIISLHIILQLVSLLSIQTTFPFILSDIWPVCLQTHPSIHLSIHFIQPTLSNYLWGMILVSDEDVIAPDLMPS